MIYAGIGSRRTPNYVLASAESLAKSFDKWGWKLRSGGAIGMDIAFESGSSNKEIFYTKDATKEAIKLASKFHSDWDKCNNYARLLHGRNAQIILGRDLNDPVKFVVCWTPDGLDVGGTAMGIKIARANDIPVFNLFNTGASLEAIKFALRV